MISFASDNHAGVHPEVMAAISAANRGDAPAYGDDDVTAHTDELFRQVFGPDIAVFYVFGGTAANVLGLQTVTARHDAVLCPETAHINVDECGAPERIIGCKLIPIPTADGKLRPADLDPHLRGFGDQHHSQPRVVSISQVTEYGTVYSLPELRALADHVHRHGLLLQMDGARIANAAAALGCGLRDVTGDAGVDLLSFGGTKNGLLCGEAVVFFDPAAGRGFRFIRKQGMQLASKMRFLSAQLGALLTNDLWRRNAEHANRLARMLADAAAAVPGVMLSQPVQANAVFATLPRAAIAPLQARYPFHVWDERRDEVRWMASWSTREEDVRGFVAALHEVIG